MNNESNNKRIIMDKKDCKMAKINKNSFFFEYDIENKNVLLEKIITLDFITIIHEINKADIFEDFYLEKHSDKSATVFILFKHFFDDFGIPQKYAHLDVKLENTTNQIIFRTTTNNNLPNRNLKPSVKLLQISHVTTTCNFINPCKVSIKTTANFHNTVDFPEFVEKMATTIIGKIFLRSKQFIEKINII
jgi:hypothetical protein